MDTSRFECVLPGAEARWLTSSSGPLCGEGCQLGEQRDGMIPVILDALAMWVLRGGHDDGRVEDEDGPEIVFGKDRWRVRELAPAEIPESLPDGR